MTSPTPIHTLVLPGVVWGMMGLELSAGGGGLTTMDSTEDNDSSRRRIYQWPLAQQEAQGAMIYIFNPRFNVDRFSGMQD